MGSPISRPTGYDAPRAMLCQMERESRAAITRTGEADLAALVSILEIHLADPKHREATLTYLAGYLSKCVTGIIPDYTRWEP